VAQGRTVNRTAVNPQPGHEAVLARDRPETGEIALCIQKRVLHTFSVKIGTPDQQVPNQRFKDQLSSDGRYRNLRESLFDVLAKRLHQFLDLSGLIDRSGLIKFN